MVSLCSTTGYKLRCLRHRLRACPPDPILGGILNAEGTHLKGEPKEVRENGLCPVVIVKKGPMVAFQLTFLG